MTTFTREKCGLGSTLETVLDMETLMVIQAGGQCPVWSLKKSHGLSNQLLIKKKNAKGSKVSGTDLRCYIQYRMLGVTRAYHHHQFLFPVSRIGPEIRTYTAYKLVKGFVIFCNQKPYCKRSVFFNKKSLNAACNWCTIVCIVLLCRRNNNNCNRQ